MSDNINLEAKSVDDMLKAISINLSISKAGVKKFITFKNSAVHARIYGCFRYFLASTGRWSSTIINFQNLPRTTIPDPELIEKAVYSGIPTMELIYNNPLEALSSVLRYSIYSSKGLNIHDLSSIEARILAWIAGQKDKLKVFSNNIDVYKYTAAKMFNVSIERVNETQRFLGKIGELSLGYQGGKKAFATMCKSFGVDISEAKAEKIKLDWRDANDKIVQLWYNVESAALRAVKTGKVQQVGKLKFGMYKSWMYIKLPSGRTINYAKPRIIQAPTPWGEMRDKLVYYGQMSGKQAWGLIDTYGGKLVENITQAIARDILAAAMVRLNDKGYDIVQHCHDEVTIEGPEDTEKIDKIFTENPVWARGLPLSASGEFGEHYAK